MRKAKNGCLKNGVNIQKRSLPADVVSTGSAANL
jgi:hypothetical protein